MKSFYQWYCFLEELEGEEEKEKKGPGHTKTLKDTLKIDPTALIGMTIPYTGVLGDKEYNMVGLTIVGFDDDENPTRVKLSIFGDSPNMDDMVRFKKDKKGDDEEDFEVEGDEGDIDISIDELDEILSKGWEPAAQGGAAGGGAPPGGPMGAM